jgi:hypothetical protein
VAAGVVGAGVEGDVVGVTDGLATGGRPMEPRLTPVSRSETGGDGVSSMAVGVWPPSGQAAAPATIADATAADAATGMKRRTSGRVLARE